MMVAPVMVVVVMVMMEVTPMVVVADVSPVMVVVLNALDQRFLGTNTARQWGRACNPKIDAETQNTSGHHRAQCATQHRISPFSSFAISPFSSVPCRT